MSTVWKVEKQASLGARLFIGRISPAARRPLQEPGLRSSPLVIPREQLPQAILLCEPPLCPSRFRRSLELFFTGPGRVAPMSEGRESLPEKWLERPVRTRPIIHSVSLQRPRAAPPATSRSPPILDKQERSCRERIETVALKISDPKAFRRLRTHLQ